MSKRKYRATKIQEVASAKLEALTDERVILAIDVAKEDFYAAIVDGQGHVHEIVKWLHPAESRSFLQLVEQLGGKERVEVGGSSRAVCLQCGQRTRRRGDARCCRWGWTC